ncbi:hypothetical protein DPMN_078586 [Dreissena polymorpha]|uniref:Regulator of G protein signalling-like domain-containing protein n=1 Tax=Dreissena polymorpha TaxID=45954 RepID=A0A9D4BPA6_DREPO|nr:hypothetical protein DPMN_078586 [Dreissena polymorpha]
MGDTKIFNDLATLVTHPAHMAVFLHYVITQHNPAPVLFYEMTRFYNTTQGNSKDLKKWAYEIHSTFIIHMAVWNSGLIVYCVFSTRSTLPSSYIWRYGILS